MSERGQLRKGWYAGAVLLAWLLFWLAGASNPARAMSSYLMAWIALLGIPLGSLSWAMIHALTGGEWGRALRAEWTAAMRLLPCALALSLPLLYGAPWIFDWARPDRRASAPWFYLNLPFFYLRCALCFACWLGLAYGVWRRLESDAWRGYAAGGLIVMLLTVSIASVDWVMSRVEGWHSTALGVTVFSAQLLIALACAVAWRLRRACPPPVRHDLANVLLAAVLGWAYLAFMDYLTAWISDLPADTVWYLPRLRTDWRWLGAALAACSIGCLLVLLLRSVKRNAAALRWLAYALVLVQVLYAAWLVLPDTLRAGFAWSWSDPLAWLCVFGTAWAVQWWQRNTHANTAMTEASR